MNSQDIIQMAKEAGLDLDGDNIFSPKSDPQVDVHIADLEAFAKIVAFVEREACAKVCEERIGGAVQTNDWWFGFRSAMKQCATAIRARGQA